MKTLQIRMGAAVLAAIISLSAAAPAFAARDDRADREPRLNREQVVRLIAKIKSIFGIAPNDDGLTTPRP